MSRSRRPSRSADKTPRETIPLPETLLLTALEELRGERVLCTTLGRGRFAADVADRWPSASVVCHFLDVFLAEQTREVAGSDRPNLSIVCEPDLPPGECDVVAFPFWKRGEAELTREWLQQGHERLRVGGQLLASTDNPRDAWLHEQLRELFDKVTRRPSPRGVLYLATKTGPLKRPRDFACEFAFRDSGRLVKAITRPGVFSHRELDVGARALLEALSSPEEIIRPGLRILDLGCGAGTVGIALALRAADVHVHAMDSNPRALQCTTRGAELNGLGILAKPPAARAQSSTLNSQPSTLSTQLDADGHAPRAGSFDVVVANPPYYSNWRIATIFVEAAARALKTGGRLFLVTKHADWYQINVPFVLADVTVRSVRRYAIVSGRKK